MTNNREQAQNTYDNFIIRTYPLFGATLVALAAWGPNLDSSTYTSCYWIIWALFLVVFMRFALAAVATYKYLFALANTEALSTESDKKRESFWKKTRKVNLYWYITGFVLFVLATVIRVIST